MTIEEAKTKICPFISNVIGDADGRNNTVMVECVADDCMAWVKTWDNGVPATEDKTNSGYCERLRKK